VRAVPDSLAVPLGAIALLLLAATALLVAATLRIRSVPGLILSAYTIGFAEVVGLSLFLSLFDDLTRWALLTGLIALLVAAASAWILVGHPPLALPRLTRFALPLPVLVLGLVAALALAYVVALIVGTPPNGWDPLNYHLPRAAFWLQSHHIGYVEPTYDERMNLNPPNAEIGFAFALGLTRNELSVGFVQFFAGLACVVAVFGLARRAGLSQREATFGSLLFLTLPIVALQLSLGKNDLVVAAFLLCAAYFIVQDEGRHVILGGVATALAVGTKSTAFYAIPILVALALVSRRRPPRAVRLASLAGGGLVGAYWYAVNLADSGRILGDQSAQQGVTAVFRPAADLVTAVGMAADSLDVSGSHGSDIFLYAIAALVVAVGFAFSRAALAGALLAASPFALLALSDHVGRPILDHLYDALGKPRGYVPAGDLAVASARVASDTASWFGAVGFVFVVGAAVVVFARRARSPFQRVFVLAPFAWFVLVAVTLSYNPWLGRFFIFPVALSAAVWGRVLRVVPLAWGATALAALTVALALVHYNEKPSGLRLVDRSDTASVWRMSRAEVQSQHEPPLEPLLAFVNADVPAHASVALAFGDNDFGYPMFGPHLQRHVSIVPFGSNADSAEAHWLVADSERAGQIDPGCWRAVYRSAEGVVFRRACSR
jgi:4-amino-4-deoxy-L-arabinose transferase-like glycosyltransferase